MYNHYYEKAQTANCSMRGTIIHETGTSVLLESKNGIELKQVTAIGKVYFELYMDGELLNKFSNLKIAKAMWKDFST